MRRTPLRPRQAIGSGSISRRLRSVCCRRTTREAPMGQQIRIAQISDLHIKPPGTLAYGRVDTAKALERCIAGLNAFEPAADFVVISGDLADAPTADEYD